MSRCTGGSLRPWLPGEVVADDGEEPPGPQHPGRLQVQGGGRAEVVEGLHGALEPATCSRAAPGTPSPGPPRRPPPPACSGRAPPCTRCLAPSWPPRCGGREEPNCCIGRDLELEGAGVEAHHLPAHRGQLDGQLPRSAAHVYGESERLSGNITGLKRVVRGGVGRQEAAKQGGRGCGPRDGVAAAVGGAVVRRPAGWGHPPLALLVVIVYSTLAVLTVCFLEYAQTTLVSRTFRERSCLSGLSTMAKYRTTGLVTCHRALAPLWKSYYRMSVL